MDFVESDIIAKGYGGGSMIACGKICSWHYNEEIEIDWTERIIFVSENIPLYQAAVIADLNPKGVILAHGSHNYHPLIFFKDLLMPCIAGTGLIKNFPEEIILDCKSGYVLHNKIELLNHNNTKDEFVQIDDLKYTYANVGSSEAIIEAKKNSAKGIGIFRTEFTAVRILSKLLNYKISENQTIEDYIIINNEADALYLMATIPELSQILKDYFKDVIYLAVRTFPVEPIIIRSIDIEREENDAMGYRGIRRCLSEDGGILRIIARAVNEVINETGANNIAIIFPLVSEYSQLSLATKVLFEENLSISEIAGKSKIRIGWKIEQPSAVLNNRIWMNTYRQEFGKFPNYIGIGTNDLTQFTLGVGRNIDLNKEPNNVQKYINSLYNEHDPAVIKQLIYISGSSARTDTEIILHGEIASSPSFSKLLVLLNISPSVTVSKLKETDELITFNMRNISSIYEIISEIYYEFRYNNDLFLLIKDDIVKWYKHSLNYEINETL